ncbi:chorismate mutase [Dyella sp.]|uniref:chorismate mutase n=1 Tax=Dyella sp. TaxID=1869338 RepID=UPI002ED35022
MSFEHEIILMRKKIDDIDQQLIDLLGERFKCCLKVGELKKRYSEPVMQPGRVMEVLERAATAAQPLGMSGQFARQVWQLIIDEACRMEEQADQSSRVLSEA